MVLAVMDQPESLWVDSIGKLLSDSLVAGNDHPPAGSHSLFKHSWIINPESRVMYHRGDSGIRFYCNGRSYELPDSDPVIEFIQNLCELRYLSAACIDDCRSQKSLVEMLIDLEKTGTLLMCEEE